ncbi:zinc-ribbon domain-containing protein [Bacteroidales bacterium OttesenSCG-928-L03]|nr:zinc-ribbon domain-containing protein [Bacteroidales bacterium OttesenSCG-928-L03]
MDDEESLGFCTNCGAPLHSSDTFCTHCGKNVGDDPLPAPSDQYNRLGMKNTTLTLIGVLSAIWAIIALYAGAMMVNDVDFIIDLMKEDPATWEKIAAYEEVLRTTLIAVGALMIVNGALCIVTAITCIMEKYYIVAFGSCLIASILLLIALVGIVGLIMSYFIYKNKDSFKEQNTIS